MRMFDQVNAPSPPPASRFQGEEALFAAALDKPASERSAFLDQVCQGNAVLRQRVQALLAADAQPDPSLAIPEDVSVCVRLRRRVTRDFHRAVKLGADRGDDWFGEADLA